MQLNLNLLLLAQLKFELNDLSLKLAKSIFICTNRTNF